LSQKKDKCKCRVCQRVLPGSEFPWHKKPNGKSYPNRICKECQRWEKIHKKFGMTKEMWWDLWEQQGGKDPVTLQNLDAKTCHVDHCHRTGQIRGLLNGSTNRGLGFLGDCEENLKRAIDYLAKPPVLSSSPKVDDNEPCVSPGCPDESEGQPPDAG
jgi:hypothetical protein